jgi:hypothetical protein
MRNIGRDAMTQGIQGKVVVISGASSGRAILPRLSQGSLHLPSASRTMWT